jgi:hypothetical protein
LKLGCQHFYAQNRSNDTVVGKQKMRLSECVAEMANEWVACLRNLGSKHGVGKIFSDFICVRFELISVGH